MKSEILEDLEKKYDLELDRIMKEIKSLGKKSPVVLLQFPDGLKRFAREIEDYLKKQLEQEDINVDFRTWLGSCFGACDVPDNDKIHVEFDLIIQFGHAAWE
jgi:diphthamide biosynthesis enzyme Dph1/Dph2-like protein